LWSASESDAYEVFVTEDDCKAIYSRVLEMTSGQMFVNVRRGTQAYGPLCVVQKQVILDPVDEKFGLPTEENGKKAPKCNLYITQIYTCVKSLTEYDPTWQRHRMTAVYKNYSRMSVEEKTLSSIFQYSNNQIIQCMKSAQYRALMQAYWQKSETNRSPLMSAETTWNMQTCKAMLMTMVLTTYKIMFQRLPTKVACYERTIRFQNLFKHYKHWYMDSLCIASDAFTAEYEDKLKKREIKPDQFNGMPTGMYTEHDAYASVKSQWNTKKPTITKPTTNDPLTDMITFQPTTPQGHIEAFATLKQQLQDHKDELEKLKEENKKMEEAKLKVLEERFRAKQVANEDDFLAELAEASPTSNRIARKYKNRLIGQKLHFGQDDDSFTARLAKIQNW
jgi:hypothetical protein